MYRRALKIAGPVRKSGSLLAALAALGIAAGGCTSARSTQAAPATPVVSNPFPGLVAVPQQSSATGTPDAAAAKSAAVAAFQTLSCPATGTPLGTVVAGSDYLASCGLNGEKYLLGPAQLTGADITSATVEPPSSATGVPAYGIAIVFDPTGATKFSAFTIQLSQGYSQKTLPVQVGITLDGVVLSAPAINQGPLTTGSTDFAGGFTQTEAAAIAKEYHDLQFRPVLQWASAN